MITHLAFEVFGQPVNLCGHVNDPDNPDPKSSRPRDITCRDCIRIARLRLNRRCIGHPRVSEGRYIVPTFNFIDGIGLKPGRGIIVL